MKTARWTTWLGVEHADCGVFFFPCFFSSRIQTQERVQRSAELLGELHQPVALLRRDHDPAGQLAPP
jgi:hypothetical protein